MDEKLTRRDLFQRSAALSVLAVVGAGAGACSKAQSAAPSCSDTTGLAAADVQVRATLAYADVSAEPGKVCTSCQQFLPGPADGCGTCKVLRGPISPRGSCKAFVAKAM
jgi:hypothetical protein